MDSQHVSMDEKNKKWPKELRTEAILTEKNLRGATKNNQSYEDDFKMKSLFLRNNYFLPFWCLSVATFYR